MGAINYGTSNYITIGLEPYDYENYRDENNEIDYEAMNIDYSDDLSNIEALLNHFDFAIFHVVIESGYYEGFYINIENNYELCFNCWQDKRTAQKEITQLKEFLIACVNMGMCKVSPGWVTSYYSREDSIKAINAAMKDLREQVKQIPTWAYCERMGIEL